MPKKITVNDGIFLSIYVCFCYIVSKHHVCFYHICAKKAIYMFLNRYVSNTLRLYSNR